MRSRSAPSRAGSSPPSRRRRARPSRRPATSSVFVAERERWSDVVSLFKRLEHAGYAQIEVAFDVKPRATAPANTVAYRRMVAIASDAKEMPWKIYIAEAKELAARNASCPAVASPFASDAGNSTAIDVQLKEFMKEAPAAVRACGCRADLDAIRALAWVRFGRHWGPTTVSYELALPSSHTWRGDSDAGVETISSAADTPWKDMTEAVIAAAKSKARVGFAVR